MIVDDHPMIRRMVRSTLEQHPHFEVCDEAGDGEQAVEKAKEIKPDVIVMNVTMPKLNGFEAAREIKKKVPQTAIVILSSNADQHFIEEAKKVGARAYIAKSELGEGLVKAVEAAIAGEEDFIVFE